MPAHPARRGRTTFLVLVVTAVLAALLTAPTAQARTTGPDSGKAASSSGADAQEALAAVEAIFSGDTAEARGFSAAPETVDASMALRELAILKDELSEADRAVAEGYLARPTDGPDGEDFTVEYTVAEATPRCNTKICVHYVTSTADAPPLVDNNTNSVPDYVDTMLATMTHVHDTYVGAGYRAPKPDGTLGGDARRDIYIADIGDKGLYGYCTSDQEFNNSGPFDGWAYCVLDDDYSPAEFPTNTPLENLQVTAAHEYFHAVQYAYDAFEDSWFLEATAAWAEDELYDAVDDNVQYLNNSPLTAPRLPVDRKDGIAIYGSWIFFRYLTERMPQQQGGIPTFVRDVLRKADGSAGGLDQYSWQAINTVLKARKTSATRMYAAFAAANRRPAQTYSEGAANNYPVAPLAGAAKVSRNQQKVGKIALKHLSSATVRLTPGTGLGATSSRLRFAFDLAPTVRGSAAVVTTYLKSGKVKVAFARLNGQGNGSLAALFSTKQVKWVEVTLVNGSGRFTKCYSGRPFSCGGSSLDDGTVAKFTVRATA